MIKTIQKLMTPLSNRIVSMIARCIITAVDDSGKIQMVQIRTINGVVRDNVERFQDYGFTSVPHIDSEGFVSFVNGNTGHGLIVKIDNRTYRLKGLENGEVALYTDEDQEDHKHRIHFKRGGIIEVLANQVVINAATKARIESDTIEIHAKTELNLDCNGHGERWEPTHKESYAIGATGNNNAINAPEIP